MKLEHTSTIVQFTDTETNNSWRVVFFGDHTKLHASVTKNVNLIAKYTLKYGYANKTAAKRLIEAASKL